MRDEDLYICNIKVQGAGYRTDSGFSFWFLLCCFLLLNSDLLLFGVLRPFIHWYIHQSQTRLTYTYYLLSTRHFQQLIRRTLYGNVKRRQSLCTLQKLYPFLDYEPAEEEPTILWKKEPPEPEEEEKEEHTLLSLHQDSVWGRRETCEREYTQNSITAYHSYLL